MARGETIRTISVVHADPAALANTAKLLSNAGYRVTAASTFEEAKLLLSANPPDLLITHVRLRAFNGLHLVLRRRAEHPRSVSIVMDSGADPVLACEAKRLSAPYLIEPVSPEQLLTLIAKLPSEKNRHWPRKAVAGGFAARVDGGAVLVLDVSYEGLRLEIAKKSADLLPSLFTVDLPAFGVSWPVKRVWTKLAPTFLAVSCGAAVLASSPESTTAWRALVDAL